MLRLNCNQCANEGGRVLFFPKSFEINDLKQKLKQFLLEVSEHKHPKGAILASG
jgi:hypothetical protein